MTPQGECLNAHVASHPEITPYFLFSFLIFDDEDYESASYFDFERTPISSGSQSPSTFGVDTSKFDYNYNEGYDYVDELVVKPAAAEKEPASAKVKSSLRQKDFA